MVMRHGCSHPFLILVVYNLNWIIFCDSLLHFLYLICYKLILCFIGVNAKDMELALFEQRSTAIWLQSIDRYVGYPTRCRILRRPVIETIVLVQWIWRSSFTHDAWSLLGEVGTETPLFWTLELCRTLSLFSLFGRVIAGPLVSKFKCSHHLRGPSKILIMRGSFANWCKFKLFNINILDKLI